MQDTDFELLVANLVWSEAGLIPVVTQDGGSGQVLMVAWMNREALWQTLTRGEAHYWSRSRQELWHKGATSGNRQIVRSLHLDCDGDALLLRVDPMGPACHTGETTCFFRRVEDLPGGRTKSSLERNGFSDSLDESTGDET